MKRITLFCGHYGSGKTNVAVNYAIKLRELGDVSIYDLDIVNPYFRTVDALSMLEENGVELIVSPFAETNVDIPAMNSASYRMLDDKSRYAIIDLGGDDRGALAMGRFSEKIKEEDNYEMVLVYNCYRPETRDLAGALEIIKEIETTARIKFTGIVNNSNLGVETTEDIILNSVQRVNELSKETGLPVLFTAVREDLVENITKKIKDVLPIKLIKYGKWI